MPFSHRQLEVQKALLDKVFEILEDSYRLALENGERIFAISVNDLRTRTHLQTNALEKRLYAASKDGASE